MSSEPCDPGNPLETPEPPKTKKDSKSDFRGFSQGDPIVTPKVTFDPKSDFFDPKSDLFDPKSGFLGAKKVTFGVTIQSPWAKPRKSLFESLLVFGGSGGSRGFPGSQSEPPTKPLFL